MEPVGAFLDEEWAALSRMFSTEEHDDNNSFSFGTSSSTFWAISDESNVDIGPIDESLSQLFHHNCDTLSTDNLHYFSQESSNSSPNNSAFFPNPSYENHYFSDSNHFQETNYSLEFMDFYAMESAGNNLWLPMLPHNVIEEVLCEKEEKICENLGNADDQPAIVADHGKELQLKRKNDVADTPKKKPRVSRNAQRGKKNATSKKNKKLNTLNENGDQEEETNNNGGRDGQSSTCCSSEDDDSNASREGGETSDTKSISALNSTGKTRAGRGAATDPQSLYARKRRERINERLRILQNLVPNGTKVDISTMLEEAVQYVKFMQMQIKLLSSDDLWMYAPIAYNGMDMGLYNKISPTL